MEWFQAVVLGILQGLTEFLPISSSAHLRIYPELFGWEDPGAAFTAVIQIGTEAAIITYLAKDIWRIIEAWTRSLTNRDALRSHELVRVGGAHRMEKTWDPQDARLGWYVIAGSLPIVVLGITLKDVIETDFRSLWIVGTTLVVLGLVLGLADRVGRRDRSLGSLNLRHAILLGLAQACALIPGVSRSGATISMALFLGYDRAAAARFAFLLAIPAVLGAGIFEWPSAIAAGAEYGIGPILLATAVSFIVGYAVVAWLFRWLQTRTYTPFVVYRVALGVLTLGLLAGGVLTA